MKLRNILRLTVLPVFFLFLVINSSAQGWRPHEMEVKVELADRSDAQMLNDLHLIGDIYIKYALMYVTPDELQRIKETGLRYEITKPDLNAWAADFLENRDEYHSYEETLELMDSLADNLPGLVMKVVYGESIQGRQLSALKISDNVTVDEPEPEMAFDANIHGDEIGACENAIRFARWLCQQYGNNQEITDLVDSREIWIYPLVNPDGREALTRYNAAGIDLNRDWGYLWGGDGNSPSPFSQPESKALRQMVLDNQFSIQMTFHSGIELFLYPWYNRTDNCPDYAEVTQLADVYSSTSGYGNLQSGPGTSLYPTTGTTAESYYGIMGSDGIVLEISNNKQPPPSQIGYYFSININPMVKMIEYAGYGVEGTVTDAGTGDPVAAVVYVGNTLPCYADPLVGDFHKFVMPGTYNVKVKANGYQTKIINDVTVNALSAVTVDVALEPEEHQSIYRIIASMIPGGSNTADEGTSWDAIGPPDNLNYSLGKAGWMVFDMQELVVNGEGDDLIVFEGDESPEGFTIYAGSSMDGPWQLLGEGEGTTQFDLGECALNEARYFKIEDDGDGNANVADAGFDLDAVQSMSSLSGPYLLISQIVVDDQAGNANGQLDPGETADFEITLKNIGTEDALNIEGTLTCADPLITVGTPGAQSYGNIPTGETSTATFTVSADEQIPAGHTSVLELAYSGDNGLSGVKNFEITFPDYCFPTANCSYGDGFTGFSLESIDNMNSGCSDGGYGDFTDMSTDLTAGETYTVSWETGYSNQEASLWIDLDDDMEFEPEELLITDFNLENSGQVYTTDFTVPGNASPGEKRLRIRANWQNSSADPCADFSYGETEDYTVNVISGGYMQPAFTADQTEICQGDEVQFTDNSTGNITSWSWEFPGGDPSASSEQNPLVTYENPGSFDVTLTVSDGQTTQSVTHENYITVNALPEVTFGEIEDMCINWPPQELTQGAPEGGIYSGPGVSNGFFDPAQAGLGTHTLTYTYTDNNGCGNSAQQTVYVDACTGISHPECGFGINPNPGKGVFYLSVENDMIARHIYVMDLTGREIFSQNNIALSPENPFTIDLSDKDAGIYFLKISTQKERTLKIIKQ